MTRPTILDLDMAVTPRKIVPLPYDLQDDFCDDLSCEHGCAEMRQERDEFNRKHNGPDPAWDDVRKYVEGLEEHSGQLQRLFDQQWKRTREAGELWRKAHPGNDSVSPDLGELVKWLVERAEAAEARIAELEKRLADAEMNVIERMDATERRQVDDESEILQRLADGDTIVFSMDGDMAWFTKGDRAFVGDAIVKLREKGYLLRKRDAVDDDDDPRGIAEYDTISEAGRAARAYMEGK